MKATLGVATFGQGGRAARSGLRPSRWVSLGHPRRSTAPRLSTVSASESDFPSSRSRGPMGASSAFGHLCLTPKLQLTWLRLLRSRPAPSCPPVCCPCHIHTHAHQFFHSDLFTLSCSVKLKLGLLNLFCSHLCKLEVWEVSSHFCVILFSPAASASRFLPPPVPCQCQFSPSSFKFPFPVEHCLVPAVVPITPP